MSQLRFVLASFLGLLFVGCVAPDHAFLAGPLRSHVTGVVVPTSTPGSYAFCDFTKSKLDGQPLKARLDPYHRLEVLDPTKIEISQVTPERAYKYSVLMGPDLAIPNASVDGWLQTSDPIFHLATTGWAFVWNQWPYARTRWVSALATGSTIIVQIVSPTEQRVFLLKGSMTVEYVSATGARVPRKWSNEGSYVTFTADGLGCKPDTLDPDPAIAIPTTGAIDEFVDKLKAMASAAGWAE